MFDTDLSLLDARATLAAARDARRASEQAEVLELETAAHWTDLNAVLKAGSGVALPGYETLVQMGGAGTPEVAEFAPSELGAVLGMSPFAGRRLVADALDLRHRLPRLWRRIRAGEVKPWIGRKTADTTRALSIETAAVVDRRLAPFADRLSWGRIEAVIDATVIEADPRAAAEAEAAARAEVGVWMGQASDEGVKTIFIKAEAPDAIRFDGTVDRTADGLGLLGDDRSKDVRRAAAIGVLADPQRALDLFADTAAAAGVGLERAQRDQGPRALTPDRRSRCTYISPTPPSSPEWVSPGSKASGLSRWSG